MINVSEEVKSLSHQIAVKAIKEAEYFPIDRDFLKPYLNKIFSLNSVEFIFHNIERVNPTYTNILFLCLPELWEEIGVDDWVEMLENVTNTFSYYVIIEFTYKYLEIDILNLIFAQAKKDGNYEQVRQYLQLQWNVIIKSEYQREDLEQGIEKEFYQYDSNRWNYIKQKLLLDHRTKPTLSDYGELENYIKSLTENAG
jgi:hypothetical protein